jgi:hypothetical protein
VWVTLLQRLRNLVNGMLRMALLDTPRLLHVLRPGPSHQGGSFVVFVKINFSWACTALLASVNNTLPLKFTMLMSALHFGVYEYFGLHHHFTAVRGHRRCRPACGVGTVLTLPQRNAQSGWSASSTRTDGLETAAAGVALGLHIDVTE